jgi:hypothetical protein
VRRNAQQPRDKRNTSPLKATQRPERLVKDLGSQVFGHIAVAHTMSDIGIHAVEIALVELGKAAGVALRRLDQQPLIACDCVFRWGPQALLRGNSVSIYLMAGRR